MDPMGYCKKVEIAESNRIPIQSDGVSWNPRAGAAVSFAKKIKASRWEDPDRKENAKAFPSTWRIIPLRIRG